MLLSTMWCSSAVFMVASFVPNSNGFAGLSPPVCRAPRSTTLEATNADNNQQSIVRRKMLQVSVSFPIAYILQRQPASAGSFTPGGTLVDRDVGIQVGNPEASPSRRDDNTNVLFKQDYYFKFGAAAPWIDPGSVDFPKTMPFTVSQQRYDNLKKYGARVKAGVQAIDGLADAVASGTYGDIADAEQPQYALRPLGLLANGLLASENVGTSNELLLARWYINEMYLRVGDVRGATSKSEAKDSYVAAKKAVNSYLSMLNRVITSKVGDKFEYLTV